MLKDYPSTHCPPTSVRALPVWRPSPHRGEQEGLAAALADLNSHPPEDSRRQEDPSLSFHHPEGRAHSEESELLWAKARQGLHLTAPERQGQGTGFGGYFPM